jgi:hypothetical protein
MTVTVPLRSKPQRAHQKDRDRNRLKDPGSLIATCPNTTAVLPKIENFRNWLLAEASSDLHQLKNLGWSLRPIEGGPI